MLMMELNRITSRTWWHLATGGMELGAMSPMFPGFRHARAILGVRADHRPADEPRLHPSRRVAQDLPRRLRSEMIISRHRRAARPTGRGRGTAHRQPDLEGPHQGVGYLDLTGCMALGITGPCLRSTGLPHDLRRSRRTAATRPTSLTSRLSTPAGLLRPATPSALPRCTSRCGSSRQCVERLELGPITVDDQKNRLAGRPAPSGPTV